MRKLINLLALVLAIITLSPQGSVYAQAPAKKSQPLPQVPITYPGDTDKTIMRRAQWIEGAKREGKLVWWGTDNPKLKLELIAEFNKVYPFIPVDHWRSQGEEIGSRMEAEHTSGRFTVDICQGGESFNYPRWRKMGIMGKFTDIVPGISGIDRRMYSKYGDWIIPGNNAITPQYNTKLVSAAEAPKTWDDLLDPRWKGHIGIPASSIKQWASLALAEGGWGIEKTENFLKKLKDQAPRYSSGYSATHALLIAGEYKIQAQGYVYHVFQSRKKGAPVEWSRVDPVVITGSSFYMMKDAPHPNAARLFLEWLFSRQGLIIWDKITMKGAAFPGAGTMTSKALEGMNLVYRTEDTEFKIIESGVIKKFAQILGITPTEGD